jgi:hypothetical protein
MDTYTRRALIAELQEKSEAGRQELVRRQAAREADIIAYDEWVRSEDPVPAPDAGLVFKDNDNALVRPPRAEPDLLHPQIERLFDATSEAFLLERKRERKEREESLAPLRAQIARLQGQISVLLALQQRSTEPKQ